MTLQKLVSSEAGDVLVDLTPDELAQLAADQVAFAPSPFKPIDPAPFWLAAWDLLQLKKDDVLNAITDPDARYEAELNIENRKHYLRDDPLVAQLSALLSYPAEQMDTLWIYVQEHYV